MLKCYAVGKTGKYHIVIPIWKDKASVLLFVNNSNFSKIQHLLYATDLHILTLSTQELAWKRHLAKIKPQLLKLITKTVDVQNSLCASRFPLKARLSQISPCSVRPSGTVSLNSQHWWFRQRTVPLEVWEPCKYCYGNSIETQFPAHFYRLQTS